MENIEKSLAGLLKDKEHLQKDLEEIIENNKMSIGKSKEEIECRKDLEKVNGRIADLIEVMSKNKNKNVSMEKAVQEAIKSSTKGEKTPRGKRKRQLKKAVVNPEKTKSTENNIKNNSSTSNVSSSNKKQNKSNKTKAKSGQSTKPKVFTEKDKKQLMKRIVKENQNEINKTTVKKMRYYNRAGFIGKIRKRYEILGKHQNVKNARKLKNKAMLGIQSLFLKSKQLQEYMLEESRKEIIDKKWEQYVSGKNPEVKQENSKKTQPKQQTNQYIERIEECLQKLKNTTEKKKIGNHNGIVNQLNSEMKGIAPKLKTYSNKDNAEDVKRKYMKTIYELHILGVPIKELPPISLEQQPATKKEKEEEIIKFMRGAQAYSTYRYLKVEGEDQELEAKYEEAYENEAKHLKSKGIGSMNWERAISRIRFKLPNSKNEQTKKVSLAEESIPSKEEVATIKEETDSQSKIARDMKKYLQSLQETTQRKKIIRKNSLANEIYGEMNGIAKQRPCLKPQEIELYNQIMYELYIAGIKDLYSGLTQENLSDNITFMRELQKYIARRHNKIEEENVELAIKYKEAYNTVVHDIFKKFDGAKSKRLERLAAEQMYGTPTKNESKKSNDDLSHDEH